MFTEDQTNVFRTSESQKGPACPIPEAQHAGRADVEKHSIIQSDHMTRCAHVTWLQDVMSSLSSEPLLCQYLHVSDITMLKV